ncbi:E3 ubiquitin/ISG15 ligase TRIM25-like [Stegostoma tigrinum]|uniref:E3 ubiquitin/ISG15 ligase TRIM25-like n=1 Tax=Stegostoma tigrinum TaxID=3053191 RepID=UPI00202AC5CF|nr:E3 ubiquitin/ISG15 ligase TRIM25-like [Stegostoma tigrinum]
MDPRALENELTCAVCLHVYQDPVTLPCQHSFCLKCIEGVWAQKTAPGGFECPQCRRNFNHKPRLEKNITLYNIVEKYNQAQSSDVMQRARCDSCDDKPFPAAKTCLTCLASFCFLHLRPHLRNKAYQDHTLIEPMADVTDRQCTDHKKLLEFYCKDEDICVCVSCTVTSKHKFHTLLSLNEAQAEIKEELEREFEKLLEDQETYSRKQRNLDGSEDEIRTQLSELKENILKNFAEWRRKLEEDESSVLTAIDEEGLQTLTQIRNYSGALNKMIELVTSVDGKTQNLQQGDTLSFIQNSRQFLSRLAQTRTVTEPSIPEITLNLSGIYQRLQNRLNTWEKYQSEILEIIKPSSAEYRSLLNVTPSQHSSSGEAPVLTLARTGEEDEISEDPASTEHRDAMNKTSPQESSSGTATIQEKIIQPSTGISGTAEISQEKSPLSLDPKTANCNLILSDDLRTVTWTEQQQPYLPHPKRFKYLPQVLCSQSFSSGSYSWDVQTDGNYWRIGIVYGSVEREGEISSLGNNSKSWSLDFIAGYLTARHNSEITVLPLLPSINRIRVQLNYEAGTLSFYQVTDSLKHLYTFQTTFTEPVFPAFYSWDKSLKLLLSK